MATAVLLQLFLAVVIAAGPEDTAPAAALGLVTVLFYSLSAGTATPHLLGMTFVGVTLFAARAIIRALTGYGGLIRLPPAHGGGDD